MRKFLVIVKNTANEYGKGTVKEIGFDSSMESLRNVLKGLAEYSYPEKDEKFISLEVHQCKNCKCKKCKEYLKN